MTAPRILAAFLPALQKALLLEVEAAASETAKTILAKSRLPVDAGSATTVRPLQEQAPRLMSRHLIPTQSQDVGESTSGSVPSTTDWPHTPVVRHSAGAADHHAAAEPSGNGSAVPAEDTFERSTPCPLKFVN